MARFLRFFCDALTPHSQIGDLLPLDGEEASHALRVLRVKVGDFISLFDGAGNAAEATIRSLDKRSLEAEITAKSASAAPTPQIVVAIAPIKKDFDDVVVRLAEIGVNQVIPITTRFGEVDFTRKDAENYAERWRKVAIRAAKQSGRDHLIEVLPQQGLSDLARFAKVLVCAPDAKSHLAETKLPTGSGAFVLLIGPEGGFSEPELAQMEKLNWSKVGLGDGILRAGTAALVAAGVLVGRIRN